MATAQKNNLFAASAPVRRFTVLNGRKNEEVNMLEDSIVFLLAYLTVIPVFFTFLFANVERYNLSKKRIGAFLMGMGAYTALILNCYYSELALHSQFAAGYINSLAIVPLVMLYLAKNGIFKKGTKVI
ncbi:MAG: hypothetical protein ACK4NC_07045 [Candidatus Gracilibacteria bacterium]